MPVLNHWCGCTGRTWLLPKEEASRGGRRTLPGCCGRACRLSSSVHSPLIVESLEPSFTAGVFGSSMAMRLNSGGWEVCYHVILSGTFLKEQHGSLLPFLYLCLSQSALWSVDAPSWTMRSGPLWQRNRIDGVPHLPSWTFSWERKKLLWFKPLILWASCHSQPNLILTSVGPWSARQIQFYLV